VALAPAGPTGSPDGPGWCLLHAYAESVLQLIQSGEPSLFEGRIPKLAEDLSRKFVVQAELVSCVGNSFALLIHHRDHLSSRALFGNNLPVMADRRPNSLRRGRLVLLARSQLVSVWCTSVRG